MAYSPTYASTDLDDVVIDLIGTLFGTLVTYAPIILIVAIASGLLAAVYGFMKMRGH